MNTSPPKFKLIVVADLRGKLDQIFSKVTALSSSHGAFDAMFCIGQFFDTGTELEPYLKGVKKVPVLTYFMVTPRQECYLKRPLPMGGQLCENLVYLGECGFCDVFGFQIAYWNVTIQDQKQIDEQLTQLIAKASSFNFKGVDLLLTNHWSQGILKDLEQINLPGISMLDMDSVGLIGVAKAAAYLTPRYHFAASPMHTAFEMTPYRNGEGQTRRPVTRFIALADAFNKKQKYIYAFSATPLRVMDPTELFLVPSGTKNSPLRHLIESSPKAGPSQISSDIAHTENTSKRTERTESEGDAATFSEFDDRRGSRFDETTRRFKHRQNRALSKHQQHPLMNRMQGCWFCLSNPEVEHHLIFSIGEEVYLAMAKGGITDEHALIIPINHVQSLSAMDVHAWAELMRYQQALADRFAAQDNAILAWESVFKRHSNTQVHTYLQVISIPNAAVDDMTQRFYHEAEKMGLSLEKRPRSSEPISETEAYFFLKIKETEWLATIPFGTRISLQFARQVISDVLGVPEREDWKNCCTRTQEEEEKMTKQFSESFSAYDFSSQI